MATSFAQFTEIEKKLAASRPSTPEHTILVGQYNEAFWDIMAAPSATGSGPAAAWQAETGGRATGPSWQTQDEA